MRKINKKKFLIVMTTFLVLIFLVYGSLWSHDTSVIGEVAGEKISEQEYKLFLGFVKREMESVEEINNEELRILFWDNLDDKNIDEVKNMTLQYLKKIKIQLIKAKEEGIVLDKEEYFSINELLDNTIAEIGNKESFEEYYDVTIEEAKKIFEDIRLVYKYADYVQNNIEIPSEELLNEYNKKMDIYDDVIVYNIFLKIPSTINSNTIDEDKAKQEDVINLAYEILDKLDDGEDINTLIKQYSQDPEKESNEGVIQISYEDDYVHEIKNWAFKHNTDDKDVLITDYGVYILKVKYRTTYEDVKDRVLEKIREKRYIDSIEKISNEEVYNLSINEHIINKIRVF